MAYPHFAIRPQLVDGDAIRLAIANAGLTNKDRSRIADFLMESYIVDLDLLNTVLCATNSIAADLEKQAA